MKTSDLLNELFVQMEWADALVWTTVLQRPSLVENSSIRDRLYHLHLVQRAFLHIWRGEPLDFAGTQHLRGTELAKWGRAYHVAARQFFTTITDSQLDAPVHLLWSAQVMERLGRPITDPCLAETLAQVVSHSTYHRGQVGARIREIGAEPPLTDFIAWVWSGKPPTSWPQVVD